MMGVGAEALESPPSRKMAEEAVEGGERTSRCRRSQVHIGSEWKVNYQPNAPVQPRETERTGWVSERSMSSEWPPMGSFGPVEGW
jgi:hypothetical protein